MTLKGLLFFLITVSFTVTGQILMKKGISVSDSNSLKDYFTNLYLIIGGFCYIGSFLVWLNVLKIMPLSIAYPASSIAYVFVIIASALFLKESITLYKIIGMCCIISGVIFISKG